MKKYLALIVVTLAMMSEAISAPAPPPITAESAILVDAATGTVLYEKRCRQKRPMASTTKIMTAMVALENGDLNSTARASERATKTPFTSLHLKPGEHLSLRNLLYGLLLRSGNDAAVCVAEHISGSEKKFVEQMNLRAKQLGAKDTHFTNPHGLHHANHYSTAYDLALIARHAIKLPEFNQMVQTKSTYIERSHNLKDTLIRNSARFLYRFEGADGIKSGFTTPAGRCFVGSATRDDWRLIAVALKSKDAGADTSDLLAFGYKYWKQVSFAGYMKPVTTVPVKGGVESEVELLAADDLAQVMRKEKIVETKVDLNAGKAVAPIKEGQKLGTVTGYINGEKIGTVDLVAARAVDRTIAYTAWVWIRTAFLTAAILIVGFLYYGTAVAKAARRRRHSLATGS